LKDLFFASATKVFQYNLPDFPIDPLGFYQVAVLVAMDGLGADEAHRDPWVAETNPFL
jgi:hypothetical protein